MHIMLTELIGQIVFSLTAKQDNKDKKIPPDRSCPGVWLLINGINQPQPLVPHEALLQPPPPMGLLELIENPERIPASTKSIFIDPQVSIRLLSTRKVKPSCSYFVSVSLGSSRASPREGPDQPPDIRAIRRAESILFCSMYDLRFSVAESVTSNITNTPYLYLILLSAGLDNKKPLNRNDWPAESCRQTCLINCSFP
jgi:hypothetical protein